MAVFQIRAKKPATGELVDLVYDNEKSRLTYAATGESAVMVMQVAGREDAPVVSLESPLGKTSPRVLKISLGLSCNYECEYCSQRFVPHADETNPKDVDAFMAGLDAWVKMAPEKIEFWGGEPFVYIRTMRPLAERLRVKYPQARLSVITNGSLLTKELNEWIDAMGFEVGLSHDGPGQPVRGPDPLDDPEKREAIFDLYRRLAPQGRLSFNAMINRENPSRAAIQQFFIKLTGDRMVRIGEGSFVDAYDEGGLAMSLQPEELAPYRNLAFHELRTGQASNFGTITMKTSNFINSLRTARQASSVGQKCGMDRPDNIAVDLHGNVLTCQNTSIKGIAPNGQSHHLGNVADMENVKLKTATHWSHRKECPNCPVLQICQGSCMYLEGDLWETTCDNAFSDAIPMFAAGIEFLTGLVPTYIEGPQREDRKDIFGSLRNPQREGVALPQKRFPIRVVAA